MLLEINDKNSMKMVRNKINMTNESPMWYTQTLMSAPVPQKNSTHSLALAQGLKSVYAHFPVKM